MNITISSGKPDDARDVTVEDDGVKLASFKAQDLSEAHKMLKQGRADGWDGVAEKPVHAPKKKAATKKAPVAKEG